MEIILLVFTSAVLSYGFLIAYFLGKKEGYEQATNEYKRVLDDKSIEITKKNQRYIKKVDDFAKFNG